VHYKEKDALKKFLMIGTPVFAASAVAFDPTWREYGGG
jgi:hypothetical protein